MSYNQKGMSHFLIFTISLLLHQIVHDFSQFLIEPSIIATHAMSHACYNLVIICDNVSQRIDVFHWNDCSHPLRHISCKLNLMVIYMLIELMLTRHNDGRFSNLQRHDKTCWATMCNYNTGIGYILDHLLIWNQLAPLAVFRLICTKARLDNHIIFDNAIAFQLIYFLN